MFKLVRRGLRANLGRLILTLLSVTLGVAFVSGSFVLADSLRSVFNQISVDTFAGVDASVRAVPSEFAGPFDPPEDIEESILDTVTALPEVGLSEGGLQVFEQIYTLDDEGQPNRTIGPPVFGFSWDGPSAISSLRLIDGEAPSGQQIAIDTTQATATGLAVGDSVDVTGPTGTVETFTVSGIVDFGQGGSAGAYFNVFDLPTIQRILDKPGDITLINVAAADGVSQDELLAALSSVVPDGVEAVPNEEIVEEQQDAFGGIIDIIGYILLGFAVIVLFVSTFIIYNTFSILVGQRTRYLGLLRSIGASAGQVRLLVLIEALIIGILASALGLIGGLGVAALLKALFNAVGSSFPDGPLQILPRTYVVVIAVGLVVTVMSAMLPAWKASRVSPLEAVRDGGQPPRSLQTRLIAGGAVLLLGIVGLAIGTGDNVSELNVGFTTLSETVSRLTLIGVGSALTFIGVSMLSALFAGGVARTLGAPLEPLKGVVGRLARDNAARNPQRTAATSTALMIGLALITLVAVVSSSISANFDRLLRESVTADLFILEANQGLPFADTLIEPLRDVDGIAAIAGYANIPVKIDDEADRATAFDSQTGTTVVDIGLVEGSAEVGPDGIAVLEGLAEERGLAIGDSVTVEFQTGHEETLTIKAIYDNDAAVGEGWLIDRSLTEFASTTNINQIGMTYTDSADRDATRAEVEQIASALPQLTVQDGTELREQVTDQINQLQFLVTAILLMCLLVAFVGIVNTMALSILERIREIGLLRAIGTTRRQLRSAVRWEAIIVSIFGSLLGVAMGMVLGWAAIVAIPDSFLSLVRIPWIQVVIFVLIGAVLGVFAAYWPARRAAKMNVLDAIAHE